ncbi:PREDICTED: leucine-rich repeat-containing protein 4C-like [Branchiostoma belcheri]|uniref:Leucine-rich repeat-containing protein 4C-like n=1 Tax=Branchiostoma belcheri TaxID=7741 RepID=A0A6P5AA97_BRABE|nr:PREDICTED: leucine-rich repeat-containing protein 4C-like [Branchiostoma belcheri]
MLRSAVPGTSVALMEALLLLTWMVPELVETVTCPRICKCSGSFETVYCGESELLKVPRGIPTIAQVLSLPYNNISKLTKNQFVTLRQLQTLQLGFNTISTIEAEAFRNLENLQTLELLNNRLSSVPTSSFKAIPALRELWLRGNPITCLDAMAFYPLSSLRLLDIGEMRQLKAVSKDAFAGLSRLVYLNMAVSNLESVPYLQYLTSLEELDLSGNSIQMLKSGDLVGLKRLKRLLMVSTNLSKVEYNAFKDLSELRELDLSYNNLTLLPLGLFYPCYSLKKVNLGRNPWNCSCQVTWLVDWLSTHVQNRTDGSVGTCQYPDSLRGKYLFEVQFMLIQCPPVNVTSPNVEVPEGDSATMYCNAGQETAVSWMTPNGTVIRHGSYKVRVRVFNDGTLNITSVTMSDSGLYRCLPQKPPAYADNDPFTTFLNVLPTNIPRRWTILTSTDFPLAEEPLDTSSINANFCASVTRIDTGEEDRNWRNGTSLIDQPNGTFGPNIFTYPGGDILRPGDYNLNETPRTDYKKYVISSIVSILSFGFLLWTVCYLGVKCSKVRERRQQERNYQLQKNCNSTNHHPAIVDLYQIPEVESISPSKSNCTTLSTFKDPPPMETIV